MKTTLQTNWTVRDITQGFIYNEFKGRALYGLNGRLKIQPRFQRNYIYNDGRRDTAVIQSLLNGLPLGLFYFIQNPDGRLQILDGQQRITSFGRFINGQFPIIYNGQTQYFDTLPEGAKRRILFAPLTVYICQGEEAELAEWYRAVNTPGIPLKQQEWRNALYSGPFVTAAKAVFSDTRNPQINKWAPYIKGKPERQDFLERALQWLADAKGISVEQYMNQHRNDPDISELLTYFNTVIDRVSSLFEMTDRMRGVEWGRLYETYHRVPYDRKSLNRLARRLLGDESVRSKKNIYEYLLSRRRPELLDIRIFDAAVKRAAYRRQTLRARKKRISNCPLCAIGPGPNRRRIYRPDEMEADHVTAWSRGGPSTLDNCRMLCVTHNRAKGNR